MQDVVGPMVHHQLALMIQQREHFAVLLQLIAKRLNQILQRDHHLDYSIFL
jgi:hypothetical protein